MAGLWISHVRLSHFRSHKLLDLELDARPVALFGSNGVGKTNVLEALSLLSPGRGLRRAAAVDIARRPEAVGWKVTAALHSVGQDHSIETSAEPGQSRSVQLNSKNVPQNALAKICQIVWLVPNMDRLWIEGADGRRRFLDRLCLSFEPGHAESSVTYEKAMRERNRLLKDQVADPNWYRALERQMGHAAAEIQATRLRVLARLQAAVAAGGSSFPACDLFLRDQDGNDVDAMTPEAVIDQLAAGRFKDIAAGRSLWGPHRSDLQGVFAAKGLPAMDCSTGEQKALLLSVVLAHARALKQDFGASPLLLLDEVTAHLDKDRCATLYSEIVELGSQAWMTGTGAEMFDALGPGVQRLCVTDEMGHSSIRPG